MKHIFRKIVVISFTVSTLLLSTVSFADTQFTREISLNQEVKAYTLSELRLQVLDKLKTRKDNIVLTYYGNDIYNRKQAGDFLFDVIDSANYQAGQLGGVNPSISYDVRTGVTTIKIKLINRTTFEEDIFISNKVANIIKEIITDDMNDLQKVIAINKYVVKNTTYSFDTINSEYSPYTLFTENKGVCSAYALATARLLEEVGIESLYVVGKANPDLTKDVWSLHAWNKIKLDGEWYNLDTTWNTALKYGVKIRYFLVPDSEFMIDHKENSKKLPEASSDKYSCKRAKKKGEI